MQPYAAVLWEAKVSGIRKEHGGSVAKSVSCFPTTYHQSPALALTVCATYHEVKDFTQSLQTSQEMGNEPLSDKGTDTQK